MAGVRGDPDAAIVATEHLEPQVEAIVEEAINLVIAPELVQVATPTLAFGRLCSWMRESDISADRAGLLCCQDPQAAFNALSRLLSGLKASSTWVNPDSPDFDADALVRECRRWEDEPFVDFVQHVKRFSAESPFVHERVAALKLWADSGEWKRILQRTKEDAKADGDWLVVIDAIAVSGLAAQDLTVDPYIKVYDGHRRLLTTSVVKECSAATWRSINIPCHHVDGKPLYCDIWDSNYGRDTFVGGFTVYPVRPRNGRNKTVYNESVVWNWRERSNVTRQGFAQIRVYFKERAK